MSLEAIVSAIEAEGAAALERLRTESRARVAAVLENARAEAEQTREMARRLAAAPATAECTRLLQQARLEALLLTSKARDQLLTDVLDEARECLARLRERPDYPAILERLAEEAIAALRQDEATCTLVEVDPRDEALVHCALRPFGNPAPITVRPGLNGWGGVVVHSDNDWIIVTNTLESRLERATPHLRQEWTSLFNGQL
jgi:V/A-type H+-transporting ATPase subunit E